MPTLHWNVLVNCHVHPPGTAPSPKPTSPTPPNPSNTPEVPLTPPKPLSTFKTSPTSPKPVQCPQTLSKTSKLPPNMPKPALTPLKPLHHLRNPSTSQTPPKPLQHFQYLQTPSSPSTTALTPPKCQAEMSYVPLTAAGTALRCCLSEGYMEMLQQQCGQRAGSHGDHSKDNLLIPAF